MTDNQDVPPEVEGQPAAPACQHEVDSYLQMWVGFAEIGLGIPITLFVGGLIIAGQIVSVEDYMQGVAASFTKSVQRDHPELAQIFSKATAESIQQSHSHEDADKRGEHARHVHLRNAQVWHPAGQPLPGSGRGLDWLRIRLSAVDGFIPGSLEG